MAIIKPINWNGFTPYWWEITSIDYDVINDTTNVYIRCYPDYESFLKNKNSCIENAYYNTKLNGKYSDNEEITNLILEKEKHGFFFDAVNVPNYSLSDEQSSIFIDISDDPNSGYQRKAECLSYKLLLRNNIFIISIKIHFYKEGELQQNLDRDITWIVDDYYKIEPYGIGEFSYFKTQLDSGAPINEVITQGILYGDQVGYVNKRLYGQS